MSGELHLTAWYIEALAAARDYGRSIDSARDLVILEWLRNGDVRPFSDWTLRGHVPSQEVLCALAVMMMRGDNPRFDPAGSGDPKMSEIAEIFPLRIEVTGKGKRKPDMANVVRDKRIALEVGKLMASGSSREKAVECVADWLADVGFHMGTDAVEKAYKAYKFQIMGTKPAQSVP